MPLASVHREQDAVKHSTMHSYPTQNISSAKAEKSCSVLSPKGIFELIVYIDAKVTL